MAAQLPDIILLDGEKMSLYSNPLEDYWSNRKKRRPSFHPLIRCRRGYVATWEISGKQLFLRDINGKIQRSSFFFWKKFVQCSLRRIFSRIGKKGVKADWFSGKLRVPRGNMILYNNDGYNSRFEKEEIITVDRGNVIKTVTLDYTERVLTVN